MPTILVRIVGKIKDKQKYLKVKMKVFAEKIQIASRGAIWNFLLFNENFLIVMDIDGM